LSDRLAVLPQYLLPKQALTALAGRIASASGGALTTAMIRRFVAPKWWTTPRSATTT
jgi:phosphatidylserine decarboxylase